MCVVNLVFRRIHAVGLGPEITILEHMYAMHKKLFSAIWRSNLILAATPIPGGQSLEPHLLHLCTADDFGLD